MDAERSIVTDIVSQMDPEGSCLYCPYTSNYYHCACVYPKYLHSIVPVFITPFERTLKLLSSFLVLLLIVSFSPGSRTIFVLTKVDLAEKSGVKQDRVSV